MRYCDSVARFYAFVFEASPDEAMKRLVLEELLRLGPRHNRYPVADIVRGVLWSVEDEDLGEFIAETPEAAWYYHRQTLQKPMLLVIERALAEPTSRPTCPLTPTSHTERTSIARSQTRTEGESIRHGHLQTG
jgi:hypothetical protein